MKATKYHQVALERLAEFLGVTLTPAEESGKGHVTLDVRSRVPAKDHDDEWTMDGFVHTGSKKYILARLVILALDPPTVGWNMTVEEVYGVMLLLDVPNDTGLAAHEWQTLRSVTAWSQ